MTREEQETQERTVWVNSHHPSDVTHLMGFNLNNLNYYAIHNGNLHCFMVGCNGNPEILDGDGPMAQAILKAVGAK